MGIFANTSFWIKNNPRLTSRYMFHIHIAQFVIICCAMGITIVGIAIRDQSRPMSRANTIALGMGAKSLIFLLYQVISERKGKWASKKANFVLNTLEILFWAVVMGLTFQANTRFCSGTSCALSWVVALLAFVLMLSYMYTSLVSWREWRESKRPGGGMGLGAAGGQTWSKPMDDSYSPQGALRHGTLRA